jgi:hypothetical protein
VKSPVTVVMGSASDRSLWVVVALFEALTPGMSVIAAFDGSRM